MQPTKPALYQHPSPFGRPTTSYRIGTLGTIIIALSAGILGYYALDGHSHRCESCGKKWRHLGAFNIGDVDAHTCGSCGQIQWWKCGLPNVFHHAHPVSPEALATRQEVRTAESSAVPSWAALPPRVSK